MIYVEILFWLLFAYWMGEMLLIGIAFVWAIFNPDARYAGWEARKK